MLAIAGAIVVITFAVYFFLKPVNKIATTPVENTQTLPKYEVPSPTVDKFEIKTPEGPVAVSNVYKYPVSHLSFDGVSFRDNKDYYIAYYPQDQGFLIVMENSDIQSARQKAENDFLQTLGIDQQQACSLRVSLTVPASINAEAAGGNYGLSFCPNGKSFPGQ